jgi:Druantia protein DruA
LPQPSRERGPSKNWYIFHSYRLRYFIHAGAQRVGCVLLGGAVNAIAARDRWIGWSAPVRQRNLPRVVNNSRFLIFPHVRIPHLASHVLGQLARRVPADWQQQWGFTPLLLETFVDPRPRRHRATCYLGWHALEGLTTARRAWCWSSPCTAISASSCAARPCRAGRGYDYEQAFPPPAAGADQGAAQ